MEKQPYYVEMIVDAQHDGSLLRDFLTKEMKVSHRTLSAIKYKGGRMLVDGERRTVRHVLKKGERLAIVFPPEEPSGFLKSEPMDLDIVYEDDYLLVVNKPAGIPVIPSHQYPAGTLANGALAYFEAQALASTVHIVNRLDRNTSGLMLIAKHRYAHELFFRMQRAGDVHRRYLAIVEGTMRENEGTIDAPIGRKEGSAIERQVGGLGSKRAVTHFSVIEQFGETALVAVRLETGRTHQIRVHFSSIGHPLAGDDLYGGHTCLIARQALHSFELKFVHPATKQAMCFHKMFPEDMKRLAPLALNLQTL